ncbi:muconate/chloromuconate family cycloisomerase [Polynucleobacter sp. MWH-Adler-W8]|jgi:muconate cycloisomerase|uniref:muconate/chloromuconate family cycloisomerase n=1 Tax=Polynucleobacter sp. MWH-Adler-W8 TaxID=1819727 RepID=UPI0009272046|nr:muconate/chloromuconate family cycloisomerase [Polynucleobacter sp. MWH-Adler-W8]OJI05462.1 muconate cycloisomerase [Polynucleobacter sp. MWH-Adler-W8]
MIKSVETLIVDVPTIRPHRLSVATMNAQALVLVRILCNDGIEGWGEATTIGGLNYGEESPESIKINIDTYFAPLIIGMKADQVAKVMHKLRTTIQGNRFAKCAIETALLDAQGKRLGIPVSELLGGRVRDQLPVAWTLASGSTDKDIAEAEKMIALRRHNIFKLKIGLRSVQADVEHVLAIKKALGPDISVRVDINQAWSELNAVKGIAALQAGGIDLIEQPVKAIHKASMARLTNQFDVAIMADEALHGPSDALELANKYAADVFAVKINQSGGLFPALQVATIAELSGISLYGGTMLEGAVGTAASAHVFSTFNDLAFGTELFGPLLLTEEILVEPLVYKDFSLQVPTGPGLGIQLDMEKINYLKRQQGHSDQVDLITA